MSKISRNELLKAARELNQVIPFDKPIDLTLKDDALEKLIVAAKAVIEPTDEFTPETQAVLDALEDEPSPVNLKELVAEASKLKDLKDLVAAHPVFAPLLEKLGDFAGLQGPKLLKIEMLKLIGNEPDDSAPAEDADADAPKKEKAADAPKKEKAPKTDKPVSKTRIRCATETLIAYKGTTTDFNVLLDESDALYDTVPNLKEQLGNLNRAIAVMEVLGMVSVVGNKVTIADF